MLVIEFVMGCSMQVVKLCDLGIDDSVCSVGWAQRGAHLAVGTSNGKLQVQEVCYQKYLWLKPGVYYVETSGKTTS